MACFWPVSTLNRASILHLGPDLGNRTLQKVSKAALLLEAHLLSLDILSPLLDLSRSKITMAAPPSGPSNTRPDSRRLADFAAKAAETFVSAYYAASDSPQRTNLVPTLYLPTSSIVWNGTPVSGQQELTAMLNSMPGSKHEVQAFDCHALGGAVDGGELPTTLVVSPFAASTCAQM